MSNIRLLSVFNRYIEQLSQNLAERFGFLNIDSVINFLLKIGDTMWRLRATSLPLSKLDITSEEYSKSTSIYNLIRAENIIIEESWNIYTTQKIVSFMYDQFMEYIIARNWVNQLLMSNALPNIIDPLLEEAVQSISNFSPAFGSILFLDKMLERNGALINKAIALIGSNNEFVASRQITMLYAFENIDMINLDDEVIIALDNFESISRNEIKERLAPVILKALKRHSEHPMIREIVNRILEIDIEGEETLSATQEELRDNLSTYNSTERPCESKLEEEEILYLPPGRYHYTEETKLNAISLLVASKSAKEYELVEKGIRNLGKMDLHSALYALASLDLAEDKFVYRVISKYMDKDTQPLPEYRIYCAWLLRNRYGEQPAKYIIRLLMDNETRVHRYTFYLFERRSIEGELINSILIELQKNNKIRSWHLINFVKLLGKRSQFLTEDIVKLYRGEIVTTLNQLCNHSQALLRLEVYRSLIEYKEYININKIIKNLSKDEDLYIRTLIEKIKPSCP